MKRCDLCKFPLRAKAHNARYHSKCRNRVENAHYTARLVGYPYPVYKLEMQYKYGEGPWRPEDIEPQDRWPEWERRWRERREKVS